MTEEIRNGSAGSESTPKPDPKPDPSSATEPTIDVVILGGGLAGQTLARHLLLDTEKRVVMIEKRDSLPTPRQKVGESSVQVGGYYFSRVLDLEEHLLTRHFMKYNLRFYWQSAERDNTRFEDYAHSYIRQFSNVASYQMDRNVLEKEVFERNLEAERFSAHLGTRKLQVELAEAGEGPHRVCFEKDGQAHELRATWVVDTTGRRRFLAKQNELERRNPIRHGAFFWWVDGLVNIDELTDAPRSEIRKRRDRRELGHLPFWMATNHFCDEGLWFWVIPLQGKTSLGLVYDKAIIDQDDVFSVEKATRWVCERFPCFARDLPNREVLDFGGYRDFSYDCAQTISSARWAMTGEAGRFTDPLYSPGSDLIAIYNTLVVDAIRTDDPAELSAKCSLYEQLERAVYQAYVPTYAASYDCLGDQECFSLKYTWELTVYFAGYVFPFLNDFFTDRRFLITFLRMFSQLGPVNRSMQNLLSGYYQWKKIHREPQPEPRFFELTRLSPLARAAETFYEVGVSVEEGKAVLAGQVQGLDELARFIVAHVAAEVLDEPRIRESRAFVERLDPSTIDFDIAAFTELWQQSRDDERIHTWSFDPEVMAEFRTAARPSVPETAQLADAPEAREVV
jgi:flavin-dependent dehydrogenase